MSLKNLTTFARSLAENDRPQKMQIDSGLEAQVYLSRDFKYQNIHFSEERRAQLSSASVVVMK